MDIDFNFSIGQRRCCLGRIRKETAGSYDQTTKNKFGFFHTKQIYTMHGDLDSYKIYTTNIAENQTGRTQIETTKNFTNPQGLHLIHSGNSTYACGDLLHTRERHYSKLHL